MKIMVLPFALFLCLLAGCTGHSGDPSEPGVSLTGETSFGVSYSGGNVSPITNTTLTIGIGGGL